MASSFFANAGGPLSERFSLIKESQAKKEPIFTVRIRAAPQAPVQRQVKSPVQIQPKREAKAANQKKQRNIVLQQRRGVAAVSNTSNGSATRIQPASRGLQQPGQQQSLPARGKFVRRAQITRGFVPPVQSTQRRRNQQLQYNSAQFQQSPEIFHPQFQPFQRPSRRNSAASMQAQFMPQISTPVIFPRRVGRATFRVNRGSPNVVLAPARSVSRGRAQRLVVVPVRGRSSSRGRSAGNVSRGAARASAGPNRGSSQGGRGRGGRAAGSATGKAGAGKGKDSVADLNRDLDNYMGRDPKVAAKEYERARLDAELDSFRVRS